MNIYEDAITVLEVPNGTIASLSMGYMRRTVRPKKTGEDASAFASETVGFYVWGSVTGTSRGHSGSVTWRSRG